MSIKQQPLFCLLIPPGSPWKMYSVTNAVKGNIIVMQTHRSLYRCFCPHTTSDYRTLQASICSVKLMNAICMYIFALCNQEPSICWLWMAFRQHTSCRCCALTCQVFCLVPSGQVMFSDICVKKDHFKGRM